MLPLRFTLLFCSITALTTLAAQADLIPLPLLSEPRPASGQTSSNNDNDALDSLANQIAQGILNNSREDAPSKPTFVESTPVNNAVTNANDIPVVTNASTAANASSTNVASSTSTRTETSTAVPSTGSVPTNDNLSLASVSESALIAAEDDATLSTPSSNQTMSIQEQSGNASRDSSSKPLSTNTVLQQTSNQVTAQPHNNDNGIQATDDSSSSTPSTQNTNAEVTNLLEETGRQIAANISRDIPDVRSTTVTAPAIPVTSPTAIPSTQLVSPLVLRQDGNETVNQNTSTEPSTTIEPVDTTIPDLPTANVVPPVPAPLPTASTAPRTPRASSTPRASASRTAPPRPTSTIGGVPSANVSEPVPTRQAPADPTQLNAPLVIRNILTIGTAPQVITRQPQPSIRNIIRPPEVLIEEMPSIAPAQENYVVQRGDYLTAIARKVYGSDVYLSTILEANPQLKNNPDLITPGMVLALPRQ